MNYSKNLRKSAMAKRVLILLGVAFCVGLAVGGVSVYALKTHITAKDRDKSIERTLNGIIQKPLYMGRMMTEHSHRKFPLTGVRVI